MSQNIDLKELERRAFRSTFQDGLWDMFVGLIVLLFAFTPLLNDLGLGDFWSSMATIPVWLAAWLGFWLAKKYVTAPRIGRAMPGPERRARLSRTMTIATLALFVGVLAGFAVYLLPQPDVRLLDWLVPALLAVAAFGMFSLGAYLLDLPRLYGYGVLVGLAAPIGELLYRYAGARHHGWPPTFGVAGGAILLIGLCMFVRFLRVYPVVEEGRQ